MRVEGIGSNGRGANEVGVDSMGRVGAYNPSEAHMQAHRNGQTYTWTGTNYNYDAADTILLIRNDSNSKDLVIDYIWIRGDTETDFTVHYTDGSVFAPTGTAVTGVSTSRKKANSADATAIRDETANTQGNIALVGRLTADLTEHVDLKSSVILGLDDCIAVDFTTDGGEAYVSILGHYEDAE